MFKYVRWMIPVAFVFMFFLQQCYAIELIISDSGRNTSWSKDLRIGDDFSVQGAEGEPVGGIMAHTRAIHQALVPMPNNDELKDMFSDQEQNILSDQGHKKVKYLEDNLKGLVHIATTNKEKIFEIRLLQNTPLPSHSNMLWQENLHTVGFARISYRAIGGLVSYLKQQKEPVHITAALADSGSTAFASAIDEWKSYADSFRRVDLVDGRATIIEIRPVVSELGGKRVRLFHTAGTPKTPHISIGSRKGAENLLRSDRYITQYTLTPAETEKGVPDQYARTPWMSALVGTMPFRVERSHYVNNKIVNRKLSSIVTGQDFREPKRGWEPVKQDLLATKSLKQLGVMATSFHQTVVPALSESLVAKLAFSNKNTQLKSDITPSMFAYSGDAKNEYDILERSEALALATSSMDRVLIVSGPTQKHTSLLKNATFKYHDAANVSVVQSDLSSQQLQQKARHFGAGAIIGSVNNISVAEPGKSFLIDRTFLDRTMKYTKHTVGLMKSTTDYLKNIPESKPGDSFFKLADGSQRVYKHLRELDKDRVLFANKKFDIFQSHSFEQMLKTSHDYVVGLGTELSTMKQGGQILKINKFGRVLHHYEAWDVPEVVSIMADATGKGHFDLGNFEKAVRWTAGRAGYWGAYISTQVSLADKPLGLTSRHLVGQMAGKLGERAALVTHDIVDHKTQHLFNKVFKVSKASGPLKSLMNSYDAHLIRSAKNLQMPATVDYIFGEPESKHAAVKLSNVDKAYMQKRYKETVQAVKAGQYHHQQQISNQKRSIQIKSKVRTHSYQFDKRIASRINRNKELVFRGSHILDRHTIKTFDRNKVSYKLDPIGTKNIQPGQLSISNHEAQKTLGSLTRDSSYPSRMRTGFNDFQKIRMGDFTDFSPKRYSMSSFNSKLLPTPDIGGVMLNASAKIEGGVNTLNTGNISLVYQNSDGVIDFLKLQRFATALWGTYMSVEGPGISIDPVSENLKHGDKHQVRYIGQVRNTELGKVMRETDHLMKRWAIGTHRPDIINFLSPDEIDQKLKGKLDTNRASRFWFIPEGLTFKRSDNMLIFSKGRMTLQTEYLDDNPKGEKNEANEAFAQWFTENYYKVEERYPIFRELFEYAQLVSLCTYLRENRVPMLWFFLANREIVLTENSIDNVDQLIKKSDYKWYVKVYGGVELQQDEAIRNESSYEDDQALRDAEKNIKTEFSGEGDGNKPVVFNANDTSYTVSSRNTLKLLNSSADGDTIQTDLALVDRYSKTASTVLGKKGEWSLIAPRLELIRYYNPSLHTRAQFGDGWHLLVPFRLETESQTSIPGTYIAPKKVVMVNLLSGIREVLHQEGPVGHTIQYVPEDEDALTETLERYSDGTWELKDILGAKFKFDKDGDLIQMTLRDDSTVHFKLGSKSKRESVPGYMVKYLYDNREVNGRELKVLTSVKQGKHTARVDWLSNASLPQIAGIRILKEGNAGSLEVLSYEYDQDEMLSRVTSKSGRSVSIKYEDDNMRVVIAGK